MDYIAAAAELLSAKQRILVFTGAGISTESGIPDFRGPDGVWTRVDPAEFTIDRYLARPETRRMSWQMRADSKALDAEPNAAHHAIVALWETGRMLGCVTQNIDGLHQKAGMPPDRVVELHGNAHTTICVECGNRTPTVDVMARFGDGDEDPRCAFCNGILKTDVVFFGELLPERASTIAFGMAAQADSVLAVGSTLSVFPAAHVPLQALRTGAPLVIVNVGATEMDHLASIRIEASAGEALPALVAALA